MAKEALVLPEFGRLVAVARRKAQKSQSEVAQDLVAEVTRRAETASYDQSFIAKLERGSINNPSQILIESLAKTLALDIGDLVGAIISDKYLDSEHRPIASVLRKGVITLPALAEWEHRADHDEIWIIAEQFYDKDMPLLQDAVEKLLLREGRAVFFLNEENKFKFKGYTAELEDKLERNLDGALTFVPLEAEQSAVLVAPFVIANPGESTREGYFIVSDDAGPHVAIKMSPMETRRRWENLRVLKYERLKEIKSSTPSS